MLRKIILALPEDVTLYIGPFSAGDVVRPKTEHTDIYRWTKERKVRRVEDNMIERAGYQFVYTINENLTVECNFASELEKIN